MTTEEKKQKIEALALQMLEESHRAAVKSINRAVNSGAIDIEGWEPDCVPMILPKCILSAVLANEVAQYSLDGTSFQRQARKEIKNIRTII